MTTLLRPHTKCTVCERVVKLQAYRNCSRRHDPLTTLYPDSRREHHPAAALHACELRPRQCPRRLPRPSPPRPRTRFLARATRPHSPNPHVGHWTILANLPIARPAALPVFRVRMPPYPPFGFSPEPVSSVRPLFSRRLSSCRRPSFSPPSFSEPSSSWATSSWATSSRELPTYPASS